MITNIIRHQLIINFILQIRQIPTSASPKLLISNWQLATPVFYEMINLDNDLAPLFGLADVTCCPCYVCILECDPHDIGIAKSYCFVLHFCTPNDKSVFQNVFF